ncbi:hypothetical protein J2X06_002462 [Lysobacter niastensis]|uniref:Lipoprotein n=1 Tax=Lysobacter niastensis TaxID=380629 RepID=A0ABU1WCC5_9GAMM|nr:hypothetical protein [Lysobacter niastensis]MDR7135253.1 hypothetical protein [Lysobacter niastensis]
MTRIAAMLAICLVGSLSGCDKPVQISGDTFLKEICQGGGAKNSYWSAEFSGIKDGYAYLRYWSAAPGSSAGSEVIHFTPIGQLPPGFSANNPMGVCQGSTAAPNNSFKPKPLRGSA